MILFKKFSCLGLILLSQFSIAANNGGEAGGKNGGCPGDLFASLNGEDHSSPTPSEQKDVAGELAKRLQGPAQEWAIPSFSVKGWAKSPDTAQPAFKPTEKTTIVLGLDDLSKVKMAEVTHFIGPDGEKRPFDAMRWYVEYQPDPAVGFAVNEPWLDRNEMLADQLRSDDAKVRSRGKTHRQISDRLFEIFGAQSKVQVGAPFGARKTVVLPDGARFEVTTDTSFGFDVSPFGDDAATDQQVTIKNLKTGRVAIMSGLMPHLVRGGFYGGSMKTRVDPAELVDILFN